MEQQTMVDVYTTKEVAEKLRLNPKSLYNMIKSGTCPIPHIRWGSRTIRWDKRTVDDFIRGRN
jgi:excisionase family DNA binding protein